MRIVALWQSLIFLFLMQSTAQAACNNETLCVSPPLPPDCIPFPNYCRDVQQQQPQTPYFITIYGASKDDIDAIKAKLGIETAPETSK